MSGQPELENLEGLWALHHGQWRHPQQIASHWEAARDTDPSLLKFRVRGTWWDTLAECGITLLVTREYEHLVMALQVSKSKPQISYMRLPHPSGLTVNRAENTVHIASTRNPNQVFDLKPVTSLMDRSDVQQPYLEDRPLVPVSSRFLPGSFYLHDLAIIGGELYANSVGQNAVVKLAKDSEPERVWWPASIETEAGPDFSKNYLQVNSIAAGNDLAGSFFSASAAKISARRPGHKNFPVDRRGIIFSGKTREPVATGLTRPHSARFYANQIWVDNSGYGELGFVQDGRFKPFLKLPGWTRGLAFYKKIAFVGTSRVIPRFKQYAPGLNVEKSLCGLHAVDMDSGKILGSLIWPYGNQIFAIDWAPREITSGFPFSATARHQSNREKELFYSFQTA